MATNTPNYNLKKPGADDFYDVQDFNDNADIIDAELLKRANKVTSPVADNFAALTATGDIKNSGKKASDFGSAAEVAKKANKVIGGTTGNLAQLTSTGDIADSGKKLSDLPSANDFIGHTDTDVNTETGVHGIRFFNDMLQFNDGTDWVEIETGGSGFAPADCTDIAIKQGNTQLTISWKDPEDTYFEGVAIAIWGGTKLVRKVGSYPTNPNDGTVVVNNTTRNAYSANGFLDTGLTNGVTYYYALFPYSDKNQVNTSGNNRISGVPQAYKIFGVSIDLANSNPETAVTYTDDAVGIAAGSSAWDSQNIFKDIKPCVLLNGVVQYYLNPNDFTKKADGTASDITSGTAGDVMIEIPKTGYKISTVGNTLTIKVTDNPDAGADGFKYYAHTRSTEGDREKLYIGAYLGYSASNKLRSLSGKTPYAGGTAPAGTIGTCRTLAQANGTGYDQVSFFPLTLLQCLFLIKYKNRDSQTALGRGYVDGNTAATATGGTDKKGMFFGETTGKQQMKFLGIEDFWGNLRWWIDGLFSDASRNILTAFDNFNDTGSGYTSRGQGATANIGNYMSKPQGSSETGFIAKEVSASATTHFTDYAYLYASRLPSFGGSWSRGDRAGVFYLSVNYSASDSGSSLGGRLMYL